MQNILKKYKWLIFDADNTLYDYDKAEKLALTQTLDDFEIPYNQKTVVEIYHQINCPLWQAFEEGKIKSQDEIKYMRTQQLFAALKVDRNITHFGEDYLFNLSQNDHLLKNALTVIKSLSKSHKLIIMTNGMTAVQRPRFTNSILAPYFKHVVISEEIKHAKPSTDIYDYAFKLMQNPEKNKVLMIGDSLGSDIKGGNNFGIDTLWYNPKQKTTTHNATYEINNLIQLI